MSGLARLPGSFYRGIILLIASYVAPVFATPASADDSPRYDLRVEEAIVSVARATFGRGYRLAFAGNPHLALLLASIAGEYVRPRFVEGNTPSERGNPPCIIWMPPAAAEEQFLADQFTLFQIAEIIQPWQFNDTPLPAAIAAMAQSLKPRAILFIGGDDRILTDLDTQHIFATHQIFTFSTTGGAARELARGDQVRVTAFDDTLISQLREALRRQPEWDRQLAHYDQLIPPYPLIAQRLVESLDR